MTPRGLQRPEAMLAWELRGVWAKAGEVRLTLAPGCHLPTIVGRVQQVAVTGAFVVVDGWHMPMDRVLAIGKPTVADRDEYEEGKRVADDADVRLRMPS